MTENSMSSFRLHFSLLNLQVNVVLVGDKQARVQELDLFLYGLKIKVVYQCTKSHSHYNVCKPGTCAESGSSAKL